MKANEKSRSRCARPVSGRGKQNGITSTVIVRQSGLPVNGVFSCGFLREVFDLLSQPVTLERIAQETDNTVERVKLAVHDLSAAGVVIRGQPYE